MGPERRSSDAPTTAARPAPQALVPAPQQTLFNASTTPPPATASDRLVTIEGEIVRVTFENEETGFRVLRVAVEGRSAPEPWVGIFPAAPPGTR